MVAQDYYKLRTLAEMRAHRAVCEAKAKEPQQSITDNSKLLRQLRARK